MKVCVICRKLLKESRGGELIRCDCPTCGEYIITREAADDFPTS